MNQIRLSQLNLHDSDLTQALSLKRYANLLHPTETALDYTGRKITASLCYVTARGKRKMESARGSKTPNALQLPLLSRATAGRPTKLGDILRQVKLNSSLTVSSQSNNTRL
jgi:hypothetical protein